MAGYSKWSKDKHIQGVLDVEHGKIFTKLSREIAVGSRMGGGDSSTTPRWRGAVLSASALNMPGAGEIKSVAEELTTGPDHYLISFAHDQLYAVAEAVNGVGVAAESQKFAFVPVMTLQLTDEHAATQVIRYCEAMEDSDDVLDICSNFDIPEELLTIISA